RRWTFLPPPRPATGVLILGSFPSRAHTGETPAVRPPLPLQVLLEARHQLDEIARAEAVVELVDEDPLPGVAAGAGRAGQREQIGAAGDPGGGAALDRRGADLLEAEPAEQLAKPGDLLL